jgi:uncharacterized membrane protein required for colicin V production
MNILDIIVIAVIVGLAAIGYRRGFVRKLASMLSLVLSVALVSALLPYMTDFIKNNTPVYDYIVKQCSQAVERQIVSSLNPDLDLDDNQIQILEQVQSLGSTQLTRIEQTELIENLPFPTMVRDLMLDYNNDEGYESLSVSTFQDYVVNFIATAILNVLSFLAATIVVQILLRILLAALDILSHIPVIGGLNRLLGLLLGLLQALFFIWIFFLVLSMATATDWGLQLMSMVQESSLLSYLYNSNLFLQVVLSTAAIF